MSTVGSIRPPGHRSGPSRARPGGGPRRGPSGHNILAHALMDAFGKLNPRVQVHNPVMLVVLAGTAITLAESIAHPGVFTWSVTVWLALTALFGNFAEALAERRGRARAGTLRSARSGNQARRLRPGGGEELIAAGALAKGDLVVCAAGDIIPSDGQIVEGLASIDESAITGESAPVVRESGGDHSAVIGGTKVLSDRVVVRVTAEPGHTFLDRMIDLVEGANRQRTPSEAALTVLLVALTIVFVPVTVTLRPYSAFAHGTVSVVMLVALVTCLIPTTIGALLSAIRIAGMDRLVRCNVLAVSGRAVEAAGDVDTLLLDKTGTITLGNRMASAFHPVDGHTEREVASAAQLASLADETPEGRSIVVLAKERFGIRQRALGNRHVFVPFSAQTRMSGLDVDGRRIRKGAADAVRRWVIEQGGAASAELDRVAGMVARSGSTPLAVADGPSLLGVIELKDAVKQGIRERFAELRAAGIRTVMITGDNPLTAAAIAQEAGVDGYLAEATPEAKLNLIKAVQADGKRVAMTGDGTNDAPALAQADVGVAMNTGTAVARAAGNMVNLDSSPAKLIDIVAIGKQLLITRSALTTFSVASGVATYFAILPAMFAAAYPQLAALNIMGLHSPRSAVLSAVIFNALIIIALLPLALRGVRFRASGAAATLWRNFLVYGAAGIIAPFIVIKIIDLILTVTGLY